MADDPSSGELVGRAADPRLLDADAGSLPSAIGRPVELPATPGRSSLVAMGVAMGAFTLAGGIALVVLGLIELLSGSAVAGVVELWAGILMVASHWGWVHVAAFANDKLQARRDRGVTLDRQSWLDSIEPYTRYEVLTHVGDDGTITIETVCHRPTATNPGRFTFASERVALESHSGDEPAAKIAERAELLRRQAAARTAQAQQRFQAALEARQMAQLEGEDKQQQIEARRAASEALSEQINSKLREPPLVE